MTRMTLLKNILAASIGMCILLALTGCRVDVNDHDHHDDHHDDPHYDHPDDHP